VLARASAFGVQAIVADVGGLSEQLKPGHILVRDDVELAIALRAAAEPEGSHMTSSNLSDRSTTDSEV
jgi:glycosyltransferase involved in cell wall biosynthesis